MRRKGWQTAVKSGAALQRLDALAASQPQTRGPAKSSRDDLLPAGKDVRGGRCFRKGGCSESEGSRVDADGRRELLPPGKACAGDSASAAGPCAGARILESTPNTCWLCATWTRTVTTTRARHFRRNMVSRPIPPRHILLAARLFLRRDYLPIAEESARKAVALNPNLPLAHLLIGEVALAAARYDEAIAEFGKEIEMNPTEGLAYERLGDAYLRTGDFEQASIALNKAVLLEPATSGPSHPTGQNSAETKKCFDGEGILERAVKMDANNYMAHSLLRPSPPSAWAWRRCNPGNSKGGAAPGSGCA